MKVRVLVAALCVCGLTGGKGLHSQEVLDLRISPRVAFAPGYVRVCAFVTTSDDNRELEIVAQSADFFRSSTIELHGTASPRMSIFDFPSLPAGDYEVSAVLLGTRGVRARTASKVVVVPGTGSRR